MAELSPAALAQRVLSLSPFRHVSQDDLRDLLRHLIEIDHIQWTAERGLIIGLAGEKDGAQLPPLRRLPRQRGVRLESREIGSIVIPPTSG